VLAAADQDYAAARESLDQAVRGAQLLAHDTQEIEVWAEVIYAMSRIPPYAAVAMGAAAIVQLARKQAS
jgi:hypothetical protein